MYVSSDGATFDLKHTEASTGAESLMAAAMLSATEHWAGGTTEAGALDAKLLALHSTDAGSTYDNEGTGLTGQTITAMDFTSPSKGFATSLSALQVCNLLQFDA